MTDRERAYRPRTTYRKKRQVFDHAREINGTHVGDFHTALELIVRYLDAITGRVDWCPDCGGADVETGEVEIEPGEWAELAAGRWWCHSCDSVFSVVDYVNPDNRDAAKWPGTRKAIGRYFEQAAQAGGKHGTHGNQTGIDGLSR